MLTPEEQDDPYHVSRKSGASQYCGSYLDDIGFPSSLAPWNADSIRSMELLGILYLRARSSQFCWMIVAIIVIVSEAFWGEI